jgi:MFS family permease
MAAGAGAAALPALWSPALGEAGSFRPLFGLVLAGNVVNVWLLLRTEERRRPGAAARWADATARGRVHALENRFLRRLVLLNVLNGLAVGLTGPLIAYWFALRFHIGPRAIGAIMAATFLATALSAALTGHVARRLGLVRSVVVGRAGGALLLVVMPLMPAYPLAALAYLLRSAVNRGTLGARQALVVSMVRDRRRGFAVSLNALSMQLPMALGPAAAGIMIGVGWFSIPFFVAAGLQGLYVALYPRLFPATDAVAPRDGEE